MRQVALPHLRLGVCRRERGLHRLLPELPDLSVDGTLLAPVLHLHQVPGVADVPVTEGIVVGRGHRRKLLHALVGDLGQML